MKWIKQDVYGNKQVWYSEDEITKYKSLLQEIRDLKKANGINDDVFKMINRFLEVK
jgi:hypothetical protein